SRNSAEARSGILSRLRTALGIRRVSDARNALISYMQNQREYQLSDHSTYTFDEEGKRKDGRFYVWEVKNGPFIEADDGPSDQPLPSITGAVRKSREATIPTKLNAPFSRLGMVARETR
ncbi:hypothetical protein, partial [Candidatus Binatus sp.]|uniref:hypothetical protein n=1 Tax=Candidatus Binatus sp. TaxID=2811406 RepID=UPI003C380FBC